MSEITVKEVRDLKKSTEKKIKVILEEFVAETGFKVTNIDLNIMHMKGPKYVYYPKLLINLQ